MILLLGMLWAEESAEIPIADQKVIQYLLDASPSPNISSSGTLEEVPDKLPSTLQTQLAEQTKPNREATKQQQFPELGMPWWWGILFGALVLGLLRVFIGKKNKTLGTIQVHSRSFFGQDGSIAVVEVKDAEENPRVFLLGMHSKGAPQFLADLSAPLPFPELGRPQMSTRVRTATPKETFVRESQKNVPVQVEEDSEEKEALVEQILRMREGRKTEQDQNESVREERDRWTEGFHEVLRK